MASGSCADSEKSGIAAKLWAAARNTVNMLTNEEDDFTGFRPIENMLHKSPCHEYDDNDTEMETMDMGLKIDAVFTLPLDTYLTQQEEEHISRPIERILKVEQQAKSQAALCRPCSVVLQKIDHDLAGRHRVFYRQWKRRFDKCGYSCRYNFISNKLRPQSKSPTKTRKPYTYKKDVIKSDSLDGSSLGNTQQVIVGKDDASLKANVVEPVKQSSNKKTKVLRDILHKKSLSKRDKLRYQYINQMSSKLKDDSTKSNVMRDQFTRGQMKSSSEHSENERTPGKKNNETATEQECTVDTLKNVKVKVEPGLESLPDSSSDVTQATFENIKVKVEPRNEDAEYGVSSENSQILSRRDIGVKLKTEPGLVPKLKRQHGATVSEDITKYSTLKGILGSGVSTEGDTGAPKAKKNDNFRGKHSTNQSHSEAFKSKSKSTIPADLTINARKESVSFAPYKTKTFKNINPTDASKTSNRNLQNRSNTVPLAQNAPVFLTNTNQVSSPRFPLQLVLTGVNATGTHNPSQMILAGPNTTSTLNPPRLVLAGLNAPLGPQNPTHMVLTGTNTTGILTNPNHLPASNPSPILLTNANRPSTSQCSQLILANGNVNGQPRFVLANANPKLPVTQSAQPFVLTNANQAVPNQVQQQLVYGNMYTNPNQPNVSGVVQTGQLVLNQVVQQLQQQTNVLSIPATPQLQPQTITGVRSIVPPVQDATIGQSAITSMQQSIPVIPTSSVLPSTMNFPPGTLFLKQNPVPEQTQQSGRQALTKLMAEKQNKQAPVKHIGPKVVENTDTQPSLSFQGKTVTIGNQKYLLVPTGSETSPDPTPPDASVNDTNFQYDGFSKLSVAKKMKLLLERNEASKNQKEAPPSKSDKSAPTETVLQKSKPLEAKPDKSPAADSASDTKGYERSIPAHSQNTSLSKHTSDSNDVILIDDTDIVHVQTSLSSPRKRNPRKSKPQPRMDYDEFLKNQRKFKRKLNQDLSSYENDCTDSEVDIETVETEPEMAGQGMLIPKTPTMPPGLRQWPDGATIGEKSITLPPNLLAKPSCSGR